MERRFISGAVAALTRILSFLRPDLTSFYHLAQGTSGRDGATNLLLPVTLE